MSSPVSIYAATIPNAPAAPLKKSQSSTTITIKWSAQAANTNGGSTITDYKIYWDNGQANNFVLLAASTHPNFEHTVSSLTSGTYYNFKMSSVNVVGESLQSQITPILASSLPGIPGTPAKVTADSTSIKISWTAPTNTGGSGLLKYFVYVDGTKKQEI